MFLFYGACQTGIQVHYRHLLWQSKNARKLNDVWGAVLKHDINICIIDTISRLILRHHRHSEWSFHIWLKPAPSEICFTRWFSGQILWPFSGFKIHPSFGDFIISTFPTWIKIILLSSLISQHVQTMIHQQSWAHKLWEILWKQ